MAALAVASALALASALAVALAALAWRRSRQRLDVQRSSDAIRSQLLVIFNERRLPPADLASPQTTARLAEALRGTLELMTRAAPDDPDECFEAGLEALDAIAASLVDAPHAAAHAFAAAAAAIALRWPHALGCAESEESVERRDAAVERIRAGDVCGGARELSDARVRAMLFSAESTPTAARIAARYERAAAAAISLCVRSAVVAPTRCAVDMSAGRAWVCADAPARVDLSGGWTDTPPICYEHGGTVVNAAIIVDGARPIGARARRLSAPIVRLVHGDAPPLDCTARWDAEMPRGLDASDRAHPADS